MERPEFTKWTSQDGSNILWIHGRAGFGKTVLCARVIEHLQSTVEGPIAYFFFTSALESRNDPFDAMRAWISQIASQNMIAFAKVQEALQNQHENVASRATIIKLFQSIAALPIASVLVIDGLDECTCWGDDEPLSVPRFLQTTKQAIRGTATRLMIVSREEPEIRSALEESIPEQECLLAYKISRDDVRPDTTAYSKSIVTAKLTRQTDDVLDDMTERMAERCDGQFLWLKLQGKSLRSTMTKKALQKFIDDAPAGLDHLYQRNWSRIVTMRDDDRDRSIALLRWAAFALRPLTVCEMTEAVLVNDDDDMDDFPTDDLPCALDDDYINNEVIGLCGSLVEVRGDASQEIRARTIHLTHFSVKQFLLVHLIHTQVPKSLGETRQHSLLARACLRYVNFESVWAETNDEEAEVNELLLGASFRDYAAVHWPQHAKLGKSVEDKDKDEDVVSLIYDLFNRDNPNWEPWRRCFDAADTELKEADDGILTEETAQPSPIYYAAGLDLTAIALTMATEHPEDVEFVGTGRSPLLAASSRGNMALVKAFLEAGASLDVRSKQGKTPLYEACRKGHLKVVEMLHRHGAEAAITTNSGWTAVAIAASNGHTEVVRRLLSYGAHAKGLTIYHASPLHLPCFRGHVEIVKLLIRGGADVHVFSEEMCTPLYFACDQGHTEIARLLLDSGVDPDAAKTGDGTALLIACTHGYVDIVKLLLQHKADATKSTSLLTPIAVAASRGYLEIVKLLLDHGASACASDSSNWGPLHSAAGQGHLEIVRLLLERGANASLQCTEGATPLYAACVHKSADVAELLLSTGCDVNVAKENGFTSLHAACIKGHLALVRLLLRYGADTKALTDHGMSTFLGACISDNIELCEYLLQADPDIDVNQANADGWSPLHAAASNGGVAVAKLLLERGATSQPKAGNRAMPLVVAAESGQLEVVKLLVEAGDDIAAADDQGHAAIHKAAAFGHVHVLEFLVGIGADLYAKDLAGANLLHLSAWNDRVEATKLLLGYGIPISCTRGDDGYTPLIGASRNGCADTVKLLLERGADPSLCTTDGCQPLTLAALRGHVDIVKQLVNHSQPAKAKINDAGDFGFTPFHAACETSHVEIVEFLLAKGADISLQAQNGCNGLHLAAMTGQVEVTKILLKQHGIEVNAVNVEGQTPLLSATCNNHVEIVRLLLQKGADLSIPPQDGRAAIQIAVFHEYKELAELLVSHGADLNKLYNGFTLLQQAVATKRTGTVALLLELGADVAERHTDPEAGSAGYTILHMAAQAGHLAICQMLLSGGVDVLAAADDGTTAVYTATLHNQPQVVKLLVEHGADVEAANSDGWLPVHVATKHGYFETLSVLFDTGIDLDKPQKGEGWTLLQALVEMGNLEHVQFFVRHGARVDAPSTLGVTPLHYACLNGHLDIVSYLLAQGADDALPNDQGFTPLHIAATCGFSAIVQALAEHGATVNVHAANDDGQTPLTSASTNGHLNAVKTLLDNGADVGKTDAKMRTALHVAAWEGHSAVVKLLLDRGAAVDARDGQGMTALLFASMDGFADTVKVLLESGADAEASSDLGFSALVVAAQNGHAAVIKELLDGGAAIDAPSSADGMTALLAASSNGHADVIRLLLDKGADATATTGDHDMGAAHVAVIRGHPVAIQALFDQGVNISQKNRLGSTPLHFAIWLHKDDVVTLLLDLDETAYNPTSEGITLLHMAAWSGSMELFTSLKDHGLDVAAVTNGGWTMMHGAVEEGQVDMVKYLLGCLGQELLQPDIYGRSVVFLAARAGRLEVVETFLAANRGSSPTSAMHFSPTAPDCFGYTPLDAAVRNGHVSVIKRLLVEHEREGLLPRWDAKDTFGRTLMSWAKRTGNPQVCEALLPLTSGDEAGSGDAEADADEISTPFDADQAWCALCLLSLCSTGPLWVCKTCDDTACFCTSCKDRGIACRKGHILSLK